jgi:hypothetical protein
VEVVSVEFCKVNDGGAKCESSFEDESGACGRDPEVREDEEDEVIEREGTEGERVVVVLDVFVEEEGPEVVSVGFASCPEA